MKKKENTEMEELLSRQTGRIRARIIDFRSGLKELDLVKAIRIHSSKYTLLILEDYAPTLGKVDGDVMILTNEGEHKFTDVYGFYKLQNNEFTFIIEHGQEVPKQTDGTQTDAVQTDVTQTADETAAQ